MLLFLIHRHMSPGTVCEAPRRQLQPEPAVFSSRVPARLPPCAALCCDSSGDELPACWHSAALSLQGCWRAGSPVLGKGRVPEHALLLEHITPGWVLLEVQNEVRGIFFWPAPSPIDHFQYSQEVDYQSCWFNPSVTFPPSHFPSLFFPKALGTNFC